MDTLAATAYRSDNACVTIWSDDLHGVCEHLQKWSQITYASVGREVAPSTSAIHLQCFFEFKSTMRATTFWKRVNKPGSYFKARIGTLSEAVTYTQKDGDYLEWGVPRNSQGKRTDLSDIVKDIQSGMTEREISLKYVKEYAKYLKWVQRMCELHGRPVTRSRYSLLECCQHLKTQPIRFDDPAWEHYALVKGDPGGGKTQYALSHFENPLLVSHIDKLKCFDPTFHDGIVFDDCDFSHWPVSSQIHLCDWNEPREIHCRYACAEIPARTKKIFVCNNERIPLTPDPAILDRCYLVALTAEQCPRSHRKLLVHRNKWGPIDDIKAMTACI